MILNSCIRKVVALKFCWERKLEKELYVSFSLLNIFLPPHRPFENSKRYTYSWKKRCITIAAKWIHLQAATDAGRHTKKYKMYSQCAILMACAVQQNLSVFRLCIICIFKIFACKVWEKRTEKKNLYVFVFIASF